MSMELTNVGNLNIANTSGGNSTVSINSVNIINSAGWIVGLGAGSQLIGTMNTIALGGGSVVSVANTGGNMFASQSGTWTVFDANTGGNYFSSQSGVWTVQPGNTANTTPWLTAQTNTSGMTVYQINTGGNYFSSQSGTWVVSNANTGGNYFSSQSGTWNVGLNAGVALVGSINVLYAGTTQAVSIVAGANLIGSANVLYAGTTQTVNILNSAGWSVVNAAGVALMGSVNVLYAGTTQPVSLIAGANLIGSANVLYVGSTQTINILNSAGWSVGLSAGANLAGSMNTLYAGTTLTVNILNSAGWTLTSKQFTDPYYTLYSKGTSQLTTSTVNLSGSGDNVVIAGQNAKAIRVYRMMLVFSSASTCVFKDGSSAAQVALTGSMTLAQNAGMVLDYSGEPWFTMTSGNAFILNQINANIISGKVDYTVV